MRPSQLLAHTGVAIRVVAVLTLLLGLGYPLLMTAAAKLPGLSDPAKGSIITDQNGKQVGSSLIGQSFTDADGNALPWYFQSRPSKAGDGYDATASGASNLGPEDIVDTLPVPGDPESGMQSLLTQICARSHQVGALEQVDGRRPYCTADGVGAVLGVYRSGGLTGTAIRVVSLNQPCPAQAFVAKYEGITVECARPDANYSKAVVTPIRGDAPDKPVVPPDAVTASASGLDPAISPEYARLQAPRVARERGVDVDTVLGLVDEYTTGRGLGVLGEPTVNVLELNLDLDRNHPKRSS